MNDVTRFRVRAGLAFLAFIELVAGAWAVLAPSSWFRNYPGFGRHWVIGQGGPFNEHLVVDAGSGFLAVGVLSVLAFLWLFRPLVQATAIAVLFHAGPHFLYHVTHGAKPTPYALVDLLFGVGGLGFLCVVAIGILLVTRTPARAGSESREPAMR